MSSNQRFLDALNALPDTATLDDIQDRLWLLMKIQRELDDVEAGRTIPTKK